MNFRNKVLLSLLIVVLSLSGYWVATRSFSRLAPAMVVSVSSDGQYALSSHQDNKIILWNLKSKKKKIISSNGNLYSAYFIKSTNTFMWQDLEDVVHLQKINGTEIKSFNHFPTYGHVITSDLKHYISTDAGHNLFYSYGDSLKKIRQGDKHKRNTPKFGKLYNLSLSDNGKHLVTAGSGSPYDADLLLVEQSKVLYEDLRGVALWDVTTLKPIAKLTGNSAKTYATISPDGKYVVSGCENRKGFVWQTKKHDIAPMRLSTLAYGVWLGIDQWDDSGVIPIPKDFDQAHHGPYMSMKFIDGSKTYLGFLTSEPYALLYDIDNPFHK